MAEKVIHLKVAPLQEPYSHEKAPVVALFPKRKHTPKGSKYKTVVSGIEEFNAQAEVLAEKIKRDVAQMTNQNLIQEKIVRKANKDLPLPQGAEDIVEIEPVGEPTLELPPDQPEPVFESDPNDPTTLELYKGFLGNPLAFAGFFCPNVTFSQSPQFHQEIYEILPRENRIALAAPRGFAKSTIVAKIYPLHAALFKLHKDICIISASEGLAQEHLRFIKTELESNQRIRTLWGNLVSDKWTETLLVVKHPDGTTCTIRAKGAGGQIRGFRPDCIILDDIETDESVENEDQRKKLKSWIFKACLNTLMPGGKFAIIGTILSPLSVLSDILAIDNGWFKRKYQAYIGGEEKEGAELWPQVWPHLKLQERKREIGSFAFASEYMNDPLSDGTAPIKPDMIRCWDQLPKTYNAVIAIDPAYSEDENADWKVAVLVGIDNHNNRYLIDYVRSHDPTGVFVDEILTMYQRHKFCITQVGCPSQGGDREFFSSLVKGAEYRKIPLPLVELTNTFKSATGTNKRNKKARCIASLQPLFEKGQYYIHANHLEARDELMAIGHSRHDDLVDALSYAENILTPIFYDTNISTDGSAPAMAGKSTNYGMDD